MLFIWDNTRSVGLEGRNKTPLFAAFSMLTPEPSVGFVQHPPGDAISSGSSLPLPSSPSTQLPLVLTDFAHSRGFCHPKSLCHPLSLGIWLSAQRVLYKSPLCFLEGGFSTLPSLDITQVELVNVMGQSPQHIACVGTVSKVRSSSSVLHLFHGWNAGTHLLLLGSNYFWNSVSCTSTLRQG